MTALGVAVVIAAVGGGAIYAATGGGTRGMGNGSHQQFGPGGPGQGGPPPGDPGIQVDRSLHGENVLADQQGGYRTVVSQLGAVTAVSPASITVRSADGYTVTYVMPPAPGATATSFAVGEGVTVRGTRAGDAVTVTSVSASPDGP